MYKWRIITNLIHEPIAVMDSKNNEIVKLPEDIYQREVDTVYELIKKHNKEVEKQRKGNDQKYFSSSIP